MILLDFGASHRYDASFVDHYLRLVYGSAIGDRDMIIRASLRMGFLTGDESEVRLNMSPLSPRLRYILFLFPSVISVLVDEFERQ